MQNSRHFCISSISKLRDGDLVSTDFSQAFMKVEYLENNSAVRYEKIAKLVLLNEPLMASMKKYFCFILKSIAVKDGELTIYLSSNLKRFEKYETNTVHTKMCNRRLELYWNGSDSSALRIKMGLGLVKSDKAARFLSKRAFVRYKVNAAMRDFNRKLPLNFVYRGCSPVNFLRVLHKEDSLAVE